VTDEIEFDDALGIAQFQIAMGRVPAPGRWVDGMIDQAQADAMESMF